MNPYLAIALVGLTLKLWAAYQLHKHWRFSPDRIWLLLFIIASYLQTTIEISSYLFLLDTGKAVITAAMHGYYLTFAAMIIIFPFSVATMVRKAIPPSFVISAAVLLAIFAYCLIDTSLIVEGYRRTQYAATRIRGEYYWVFQATTITIILFCLSLLAQIYRHDNDEIIRIKSANLLIGFIPFGVGITFVIIAMRMGATFTAAGVLPLLISVYIVVLAENLRDDRLLDLRAYLPWTEKARLLRRLAAPMRRAGLNHKEVGGLAEVYRRTLEHQNRQVRLSKAAETSSADSVHEFDPAVAEQAPRR